MTPAAPATTAALAAVPRTPECSLMALPEPLRTSVADLLGPQTGPRRFVPGRGIRVTSRPASPRITTGPADSSSNSGRSERPLPIPTTAASGWSSAPLDRSNIGKRNRRDITDFG